MSGGGVGEPHQTGAVPGPAVSACKSTGGPSIGQVSARVAEMELQWNLSILDTLGPQKCPELEVFLLWRFGAKSSSVLNREVSILWSFGAKSGVLNREEVCLRTRH